MKFTEAKLEQANTKLLGKAGYPHVDDSTLFRQPEDVFPTCPLMFLAKHNVLEISDLIH